MPDPRDAIVAVSTPRGEGAIAVVRLTGPTCLTVADRLFRGRESPSTMRPGRLSLGEVRHPRSGALVDEALVAVFHAPRSYTTQNMVEISCHGGDAVVRAILDAAVDAGARLAEPGEFTLRAFLGGRLDLAQAEAVSMLVKAKSEAQRKLALRQLKGGLSRAVTGMCESLTRALAEVEASIDFPEDDPDAQRPEDSLLAALEEAAVGLAELLRGASASRLVNDGARVAIVGKPNVGKSSVLNTLCGRPRAIVDEEPGTTRDTVEAAVELDGVHVTLIDTAGLGEPDGPPDEEGQRRTLTEMEEADLCLLVMDGSEVLDDRDRSVLGAVAGRTTILVRNKCDLGLAWIECEPGCGDRPLVTTSCLTGAGIDELKNEVIGRLRALAGIGDMTIAVSARHQQALWSAARHVEEARSKAAEGAWLEVVAEPLRRARICLRGITGENVGDDVLAEIFSRFCVGK